MEEHRDDCVGIHCTSPDSLNDLARPVMAPCQGQPFVSLDRTDRVVRPEFDQFVVAEVSDHFGLFGEDPVFPGHNRSSQIPGAHLGDPRVELFHGWRPRVARRTERLARLSALGYAEQNILGQFPGDFRSQRPLRVSRSFMVRHRVLALDEIGVKELLALL
jgi:hypothetical protein